MGYSSIIGIETFIHPNQSRIVSHMLCTRTPTCRAVGTYLSDPFRNLRHTSQFGRVDISQPAFPR